MKGTKTLKVLRPTFAELHVLAHNADDVGLLLQGVGKISRHGHGQPVSQENRTPRVEFSLLAWKNCEKDESAVESGGKPGFSVLLGAASPSLEEGRPCPGIDFYCRKRSGNHRSAGSSQSA